MTSHVLCRSGRLFIVGAEVKRVIRNSGAKSRPVARTMGTFVTRESKGAKEMCLKLPRELSEPIDNVIMLTGASGTLREVGTLFHSKGIGGVC